MVNALPMPSSVHVAFTGILGMIVIALTCFAFYTFRMSSTREQSFTDAMKVIRAATEIVAAMAERGLPSIRGRVDALESHGRAIEQSQRKANSMLETLGRAISSGPAATPLPVSPSDPVAGEAAMLAARKAARAAQTSTIAHE